MTETAVWVYGDNYIFLMWHLICWTCQPSISLSLPTITSNTAPASSASYLSKLTDQSRKFSSSQHPGSVSPRPWCHLAGTWPTVTADFQWNPLEIFYSLILTAVWLSKLDSNVGAKCWKITGNWHQLKGRKCISNYSTLMSQIYFFLFKVLFENDFLPLLSSPLLSKTCRG